MSAAARSFPPPPARVEPRKPGLRSTSPRRFEATLRVRDIIVDLVAERRISVRELAEAWECPPSHAADKLAGDRPIHLGEVLMLPARVALEIIRRAEAVVLDRSFISNAHR